MKRKRRRYAIRKIISAVCVMLMITILLSGCQRKIPETQKHNYIEVPNGDCNITGIPEFVGDISLCEDPKKQYVLPDGYLYGCQPVPIFSVTNQLSIATDEKGTLFHECGYQDNARIRSILEIGESDFSFVTGYIPIQKGDVVYFNGNCFDPEYKNAHLMYIAFYNSDKKIVSSTAMNLSLENAFEVTETHADGYISAVKLRQEFDKKDISYIRFTLIGSGRDRVISVNEPLVPNDYHYEWVQIENYIPETWYGEIQNTIQTINDIDLADETNVIKFMFASDIHLNPYSQSSYTENLGKVSAEVMRACNIPFFVTGGDNCTQSSEFMPSDFEPNMKELLEQLSPIPQKNILLSVGNHDGATGIAYDHNGEKVHYRFQLNNEQRSSVFFDWQRESNEHKKFDSDGTYYYLDDPNTKTRYIILNSFWSQWEGNAEGYVPNVEHSFFVTPLFGSKQLKWFAEEALDMPQGYGAILVAHFAPAAKDFEVFKGIVDAFSNQTTYKGSYVGSEDWQSTKIAVNYENAYGEIIAVFQGHNHTDTSDNYFDKVPCINVTTAGAHWAVRDEYDIPRIKGTASEFAVDTVVIDRVNRKIHIIRLGAGYDRKVDY